MAPPCHRARSSEPAADLLTSLPPPLLDCILTRLDLRDAVRTSALSRAWRRRWEALPSISLSFLDKRGTPPVAVDRLLVRYPGHISHFSFYLDEHSLTRVADWLIALYNRAVKSINLQCAPYLPDFNLHSSVFLCTQLVYLELHQCCIPPLPVGFTSFPVLEELKLDLARFPENGESLLEAILGASPLLNTLNLSFLSIRGDGSNEWVIGGPSLRSLTINCMAFYGWRIADLPCLDEASIDLVNYVSSGDFEGFIARFAPVRKLSLHTSYPLPLLTNGHLMETLPCTFNNLKSLILWTHFCERPAILSTFCLLTNAPNLEELEITIDRRDVDGIEANAVYQDTQLTDAFCANLQVVKIYDIGWLSNEMCFIELVLSKAKVLRTMHLRLGCLSSKFNEDALCELMTYRRASPHAQVFFNGEIE
ncbi:hypothetical protein QYE76_005492 [Lolium multiflorum]|uniref:F-box domain-containing protein n=1 Tax=Lolium multiflorum TaxID=4521 RepID=A0AAD8RUJ8_LOLMU|nr:hypothetical protein QYE76_005492 [Lolium multiflorum]